jgi:signal transduction histidine kinase
MIQNLSSRRFVYQIILVFVVFTLATVIGLGVPVTLLLNRQIEAQMRAVLDQASQTTIALYANKMSQLEYLVALITERPTLNQLVFDRDDPQELDRYLDEFLDNANVDSILVCRGDIPLALAGKTVQPALCSPDRFNAFTSVNQEVWLLVNSPLPPTGSGAYHVVVGQRAESIFNEFERQSGLAFVLFEGQQLAVSSDFEPLNTALVPGQPQIPQYTKLALDPASPGVETHIAGLIPLEDQSGFTLIGLLEISTYRDLSRNVRNIILVTLITVSLVGALVAVLVSRRISQPLNRLARSAAALREGDLATPLAGRSKVWEIDQLTNALEDARVSLKHSLDQLQREKAWMENLLNAVVEGLLAIDKYQRITFASESVERIVGAHLVSILRRPLDDVFKPPSGEIHFSQQLPATGQSRRIPVVVNGREILLAVSSSRLVPPDAGDATLALVIRDVTDEERIHRLIGEFLANITHEFRTPLSALSASVELLLDQLPSLTVPEAEQLLLAINIGIIDLQSLIDNLIEAASIEAGRFKVNPRPVQLQGVIQDAIRSVEPIAQRQGLRLDHQDPEVVLTVNADQRRTCQALINLLSNAIKHSPDGGTVRVISVIETDSVRVEVHDQGKGVPVNQRANLFNRFITPSTDGDYGQLGLGLGLSVVKAIVEAQRGSVGFRDGDFGGAVFWFTLPIILGDEK